MIPIVHPLVLSCFVCFQLSSSLSRTHLTMPLGIHIPRKYTAKSTTAPIPDSYTPTPGPSRPHHLLKTNPKRPRPLVYLSDGRTLSQTAGLPPIAGQIGFAGDRPQDGLLCPPPFEHNVGVVANDFLDNDLMFMHDDSRAHQTSHNTISRHRRRRLNQSNRWLTEVLPALISPYMSLIQQTDHFRLYPSIDMPLPARTCNCQEDGKVLKVFVVCFYGER